MTLWDRLADLIVPDWALHFGRRDCRPRATEAPLPGLLGEPGQHAHVTAPDGSVVYDGPAPVPLELVTLTPQMVMAGQAYTFDMGPARDTDIIPLPAGPTDAMASRIARRVARGVSAPRSLP